jgi:hypothetical protein
MVYIKNQCTVRYVWRAFVRTGSRRIAIVRATYLHYVSRGEISATSVAYLTMLPAGKTAKSTSWFLRQL